MRAGRLDQRVVPQLHGTSQDAAGQPVEGWTNLIATGDGMLWARVQDISGREYVTAGAERAEVTTQIEIRYRTDITAAMRILHGADTYEVLEVLRKAKTSLVMMCKRVA